MEKVQRLNFLFRYRILRHILFWMWVYSLDVVIFGLGYQKVYDWMLIAALEMPGQMLLAYITVYWILPNHFKNPNYFRTIALFLFFFFINGLIGHLFFVYYPAYDEDFGVFNFSRIMLMGFYCSLKSFLFVAFCLLKKWYENEKTLSDMEKNKVESELKMLKDQVNPHFMFKHIKQSLRFDWQGSTGSTEISIRIIWNFALHALRSNA